MASGATARAPADGGGEEDEPPLRCIVPARSEWERYGPALCAIESRLYPTSLTDPPEEIKYTFENEQSLFVVALLGDEVAGFCSGEPIWAYVERGDPEYDPELDSPKTLYVESLGVAPERQGRGVGKALLRCFSDEARRRGFTRLVGHWRAGASAAIVRKLGGEVRHVDADYNGTGETFEYIALRL